MKERWSYKGYEIEAGLKPGGKHFQYFFSVSKGNEKKCNFCVWIEDDALSRFDQKKDFEAIAAAQGEAWERWVKTHIDEGDFQNKVLKFEKGGEKEIDLSEMREHLSME
ncbi:MAG: hypothetical protein JRL30_17220 [Deltaproteobacteria bacterium]|nr:hypothetical protein [Deltaproteobacteria bacterium]